MAVFLRADAAWVSVVLCCPGGRRHCQAGRSARSGTGSAARQEWHRCEPLPPSVRCVATLLPVLAAAVYLQALLDECLSKLRCSAQHGRRWRRMGLASSRSLGSYVRSGLRLVLAPRSKMRCVWHLTSAFPAAAATALPTVATHSVALQLYIDSHWSAHSVSACLQSNAPTMGLVWRCAV